MLGQVLRRRLISNGFGFFRLHLVPMPVQPDRNGHDVICKPTIRGLNHVDQTCLYRYAHWL
jgi:hypothetical protein